MEKKWAWYKEIILHSQSGGYTWRQNIKVQRNTSVDNTVLFIMYFTKISKKIGGGEFEYEMSYTAHFY
jgi:hypothetical protein